MYWIGQDENGNRKIFFDDPKVVRADGKKERKAANTDEKEALNFDRVFNDMDHDHIGIVLENHVGYIMTAEGNVENVSRIRGSS